MYALGGLGSTAMATTKTTAASLPISMPSYSWTEKHPYTNYVLQGPNSGQYHFEVYLQYSTQGT